MQLEYGLRNVQLTSLPLGGDLSTAVYRAVTDDGTPLFCKLKRGVFDETSVALPDFPSKQGIAQIIPPPATNTGLLRAELHEFHLILYPFIEGQDGYQVELTERQWADFGSALKRIHTAPVPPALIRNISEESYASDWRDRCRNIIEQLDEEAHFDHITSRAVEQFYRGYGQPQIDPVALA